MMIKVTATMGRLSHVVSWVRGWYLIVSIPDLCNLSYSKCTYSDHGLYEPKHEISNNVVCATSKASDQPAHT